MAEWDPAAYLVFERQRTQPSIDLAARVDVSAPGRIIDIGCGPGNSTAVLAKRWPEVELVGLDNSPAMLDQAKAVLPHVKWVLADATGDLGFLGKFDLVFSNAVIQWISDQEAVLASMFGLLRPGGVMAVQVPDTDEMPVHTALVELLAQPHWQALLGDVPNTYTIHRAAWYYDVASALADSVDLWVTQYMPAMASHDAIVEWYRGTGLRPYLERLTDQDSRAEFLEQYRSLIVDAYPVRRDGKVLFPFHRVFFLARAKWSG
ncbi:MAG: methyltransferase domain-containing protein [Micrococcales bacterium]|nr:methyltransferase domain-containing protein [Micrococcales bacterium]